MERGNPRSIASSGRETGGLARAENEARYLRSKIVAIGREEIVVALHESLTRLENAEALILVDVARSENGLLTDDALAFHLDVLARGIMYQPSPRHKLHHPRTDILYPNEVRKHVMLLRRLRLVAQVHRANGNADAEGFPVEERCSCHRTDIIPNGRADDRNRELHAARQTLPAKRSSLTLPERSPHRLRPDHRITGLAAECLREFRHVRERAVRPPAPRRVWIGIDANHLILRCDVLPPDLRPCQEEALLRRKSVDQRLGLSLSRLLQRRICHRQAADVRRVLAEREPPVHVNRVEHGVSIVLVGDQRRPLLELLEVLGAPPVLEVPLSVELRALVVEAVTHLVTDHASHPTVVHGIVRRWREERRLQDSRGEDNFVQLRIVVRIDGRRSHPPLSPVERLAD